MKMELDVQVAKMGGVQQPLPTLDSPDDFLHELSYLSDAALLKATVESLHTGRLTPLIKEELRCRIQSRRLSEGKDELRVQFESPTRSEPRPEEIEKLNRRREQNRRAAQKFRRKKKERGKHLTEESQRLECDNNSLRSEISKLNKERDELLQILSEHVQLCHSHQNDSTPPPP
ncbi:cyclic AMP-dependent transcription factor ATF-3-like [Babylonia areolata]|uniref:cyclic AMP-dependent transcription factor ATF-3-like n=1 Tax=Babylonia areolata TaxID=304850 RepID=UPI003FD33FFB